MSSRAPRSSAKSQPAPPQKKPAARPDRGPRRGVGEGQREIAGSSSPARLLRGLFLMQLSRAWDLRFEAFLRTGKLGKWYSGVGNEATTVACGLCLQPGDALLTLHRDVGAILALYLDVARLAPDLIPADPAHRPPGAADDPGEMLYRLACQMLGRQDGFSQGVERSYHYGRIEPGRGLYHVGMISHLGAMMPVAAGMALSDVQRGQSSQRVSLNFIGEGATSEGDFHESLNMAAVWKLPLVVIIENNRFAFSTPVSEQFACERLSDRALGYGMAGETIDGNDFLAVTRSMSRAVERARRGEGPTLIEAMLGRMRGHAEGDGSIDLVPADERRRYLACDPLGAFGQKLVGAGVLSAAEVEALAERARTLVDQAVDRAAAAADPALEVAHRPVFAPTPVLPAPPAPAPAGDGQPVTYIEGIRRALLEEMERDPAVFLMGQDIAAFGGAFRATQGLSERFGRWRVMNTPIVESGALGVALGASLRGGRPVVEMQFADFISCGHNQLVNNIARTYYRWQQPVGLVIRLPAGGGAGAGPFHSQSTEAWFAHTPGLKVVYPSTVADAYGLMKSAIRDGNPVLYFEHKFLYRREKDVLDPAAPPVPLGQARVIHEGSDVTVLAWGWMAREALAAAQELAAAAPLSVDVVDLRSLVPLDLETVLASVKKTGKVLIVHEAGLTCGFGAELSALIGEQAFEYLDGPVRRLATPDRPSPYNKKLEAELLPDRAKIIAALRDLAAY